MKTEREIKTELAILMLTEAGPRGAQIAHREGRIRALVWALTGEDVGWGCLYPSGVDAVCTLLGWTATFNSRGGYVIDYGDDVDEQKAALRGVHITS